MVGISFSIASYFPARSERWLCGGSQASRHFAANKEKCLEVADLFDIKQAKTETLKQYLVQFNGAMVQVDDLDQKFFVKAFQKGLREAPLVTPSMNEIQARAKKYVEVEEDKEDRLQAEKELLAMGKKIDSRVQAHQHYGLGGASQREACVEKYTSFKATRAQILKEVYHLHLLYIPPAIKQQLGPSREEWCEFHRARGHKTKECRDVLSREGRMRSRPLESSLRGAGAKLQDEIVIMSRIDLKAIERASQDLEAEPPYPRSN
ncbi:hypothetical protein CR513_30497, partial [Mucuna pruriens]